MSFEPIEISNDAGQPGRAYMFKLGAAEWRYVSGPNDITLDGKLWRSVQISDDGVSITGEAQTDVLQITASDSIGPAQLFVGIPPSAVIEVMVYGFHYGDNNLIVEYIGEVNQVDRPVPGTAKLSCESLFASMERDGLRYGWQKACPYALYDSRTCKVDRNAFKLTATITAAANGIVTSAAFATKPSGYFNGGLLIWEHPVRGTEMRSIEEHSGDQIRVFGSSQGLYPGLVADFFPGCKRTLDDCHNRFNNMPNYGGVPDMPGRSPFDGNPVF